MSKNANSKNPKTPNPPSKTKSISRVVPTETESQNTSAPLTIDQQIAQLDAVVEWFYGDDFSLAQAVAKYQSAIQIAQAIDQSLDQLENQVEVLAQDFAKS